MRRIAGLAALLIALGIALSLSTPLLASALPSGTLPGSNSPSLLTTTLGPVADAYVSAAYPSTNYGTQTSLRVDGSPVTNSFLRFYVSGTNSITKATLRLYANSSLSSGINLYRVSDNAWGEATVNFSNASALGSLISTSSAVTLGAWVAFDVTSYASANATFSFAVSDPNSTALSLASRESTNKPQLIIESGSSATATPIPPVPPRQVSRAEA